ncbi:MAG: sterol desaturase family protein [Chitinophagales bacterium]|nr:sterol desaturase family protein [Chitinophagales bacterium]
MQVVINFFTDLPSYHRTIILASGFMLMWMIESIIPLFKSFSGKARHTFINLFFTFTTLVVNFILGVLLVKAADFTTENHFGLLYLFSLPLLLHAILGFMFLDLIGSYSIHWLEHKVKWMWKFHVIHHTDQHINTSTALRHHPGESIFRALFTVAAILIVGAPVWLVFLYQTCSAFFSQFNHANIHLPKWFDKMIELIFVSPDMHKVHHHQYMPLTDTNYGNIFSFWDRIFGTYVHVKDAKEVEYGLDIYPLPKDNNDLAKLLRIPFEPYIPPAGSKFSKKEKEIVVEDMV